MLNAMSVKMILFPKEICLRNKGLLNFKTISSLFHSKQKLNFLLLLNYNLKSIYQKNYHIFRFEMNISSKNE